MQTVACFIARALHPDIHIEYPTPSGFLSTYSKGEGRKWTLTLGKLKNLIDSLGLKECESHLTIV